MKRTPGKWVAEETHNQDSDCSITWDINATKRNGFHFVAEFEKKADAVLASASKELLRALKGLMTCQCGRGGGPEVKPGTCRKHWLEANLAIAKAEGRLRRLRD